jgi:hypothetical protein
MIRIALVLLLSATAGCTETIELTHDPLANLVTIEVAPADATITILELAPPNHTLQYQAFGRFEDGSIRDLTGVVTWTIDHTELGAFEPEGLFVASHAAVGHGRVSAAAHDLVAEQALTIVVDATIIDPTFPPPAANLFDPPNIVVSNDPAKSPQLAYPTDGTLFLRGVSRTLFQLTRGTGNDAARLTFENDLLRLSVETRADRWASDGVVQQLLASAGVVSPLRTEIRGTSSAAPGTIYVGATTNIAFSNDTNGGPIYFTSLSTNGITRGALDATSAATLYPRSSVCAGCHAVSRSGGSLAMAYETGATSSLHVIEVADQSTTIPASPTRPMGWASYSPDGTELVVANNGSLVRYDARTGSALGAIALPASRFATHPDWSPDGKALAVALSSSAPTNRDVKAASIAILPFDGAAFAAPTVLIAGSANSNNYFPRWSPDGRYLAFVHATSASQGAISAELSIVPRAGGAPVSLRTANRRVARSEQLDLANTMPAWGPQIGERLWLAFVSGRPYGIELAGGRGQIWITSIDPNATTDSSTAAFWLPCQDVTVMNYNPAWSSEAITQ